VRRHARISDDVAQYLHICINEAIHNVEDHAASPVGAVMGARFFTRSQEVRIAIVDGGVGIATSLRTRYATFTTAKTCLQKVIEGGYSALSRRNNMGVGISNLCNIVVQQLGGAIIIVSEDGYAKGQAGHMPLAHSLVNRYPGTGVFCFSLFRLPRLE
jgi:two-component sensor histidine kinase